MGALFASLWARFQGYLLIAVGAAMAVAMVLGGAERGRTVPLVHEVLIYEGEKLARVIRFLLMALFALLAFYGTIGWITLAI